MPTPDVLASFWRDWDQLSPKQQREFRNAVAQFIANLAEDKQGFHPRLRVKRVQALFWSRSRTLMPQLAHDSALLLTAGR
jgi:hypothetical protein